MALIPNVVVVNPGELITAAHLNNIRANLDRLDTTKLALAGGVLSGNLQLGGDPTGLVAGLLFRTDGVMISRVQGSAATTPNLQLHRAGAPTGDVGSVFVDFRRIAAATGVTVNVGSIQLASGPGTAYVTTSDERLKDDAGPVDWAAIEADVMALQLHRFRWKYDPDAGEQLGLYAQEAAPIAGDAVSVGDDDLDDPDARAWGIDYSRLVPRLLAQVQHLTRRVAELEEAATS